MTPESSSVAEPFTDATILAAKPTATAERMISIDTLRGVAVLGILVMNVYGFAMSFSAYSNPLADGGSEGYNIGTWVFTHLLFDQKFMSIFSMLFGGGLVMMMQRADARGVHYGGVWYRRNFWLLLFGAAHGYLLWMGDILFHYAVIGMLIFPLRAKPPRTLLLVGIGLLAVAPLLSYSTGNALLTLRSEVTSIEELLQAGETLDDAQRARLDAWQEMSTFVGDPREQIEQDNAAYRRSYSEIVKYRRPTVTSMQTTAALFYLFWRVGGLMLIGMALMKLGILQGERNRQFYRQMMAIGYGLGLPIVAFGTWGLAAHQWDPMYAFRIGLLPNYFGSILVALGHIGLVMLILKHGIHKSLMSRFAAVGQMAFSNYLMHSIILTTVFYGYGLGLYGHVPRIWQMCFVVGVIGFQLWLSPIWLQHYRFGPAEWLWRSLTYWKLQPMKRGTN